MDYNLGIKPLSVYGLVHFPSWRRGLVEGSCVLSLEEQSHTLSVLREHLLDVDSMEPNMQVEIDSKSIPPKSPQVDCRMRSVLGGKGNLCS